MVIKSAHVLRPLAHRPLLLGGGQVLAMGEERRRRSPVRIVGGCFRRRRFGLRRPAGLAVSAGFGGWRDFATRRRVFGGRAVTDSACIVNPVLLISACGSLRLAS